VSEAPSGPPREHLRWAKGGHAEIRRVERDTIELRSTTPAPPGARLEATLAEDPPTRVHVKSYGTRREADGAFALAARLLDATRELRERLAELARLASLHPPQG
jgi:hypothetical protein